MTPAIDLSAILALPVEQRIEVIGAIWDSIPEAEMPGLTDAQKRELDRRLEDHRQNPDDVVPWEEVQRAALERRRW